MHSAHQAASRLSEAKSQCAQWLRQGYLPPTASYATAPGATAFTRPAPHHRAVSSIRPRVRTRGVIQASDANAAAGAPVSFELNEGQVAAPVSFLARAGGEMLFLTPNEAYLEAIQLPPSVAALSTTSGLLAPRAVRRAHRAAPAPAPP